MNNFNSKISLLIGYVSSSFKTVKADSKYILTAFFASLTVIAWLDSNEDSATEIGSYDELDYSQLFLDFDSGDVLPNKFEFFNDNAQMEMNGESANQGLATVGQSSDPSPPLREDLEVASNGSLRPVLTEGEEAISNSKPTVKRSIDIAIEIPPSEKTSLASAAQNKDELSPEAYQAPHNPWSDPSKKPKRFSNGYDTDADEVMYPAEQLGLPPHAPRRKPN